MSSVPGPPSSMVRLAPSRSTAPAKRRWPTSRRSPASRRAPSTTTSAPRKRCTPRRWTPASKDWRPSAGLPRGRTSPRHSPSPLMRAHRPSASRKLRRIAVDEPVTLALLVTPTDHPLWRLARSSVRDILIGSGAATKPRRASTRCCDGWSASVAAPASRCDGSGVVLTAAAGVTSRACLSTALDLTRLAPEGHPLSAAFALHRPSYQTLSASTTRSSGPAVDPGLLAGSAGLPVVTRSLRSRLASMSPPRPGRRACRHRARLPMVGVHGFVPDRNSTSDL